MQQNKPSFWTVFTIPFLAFSFSFCAIRVYEYTTIAYKSFVEYAWLYEVYGLLYDLWTAGIYGACLALFAWIIYLMHYKASTIFIHIFNTLLIAIYLSFLVVYSERNTPFDHELFTRSFEDSFTTTKQMLTSGWSLYVPFILLIAGYYYLNYLLSKKLQIEFVNKYKKFLWSFLIFSVVTINFSKPVHHWYKTHQAYLLSCNKLNYWVADSYEYLANGNDHHYSNLNDDQLAEEINFYQQNQGFDFVSKEYPLLRNNNDPDVLGSFFNLKSQPPNIVLLVVEGLSRDFSGANAFATSFTPFLDSLSQHSLVWDNFLSTAPGTFAAHPALSGSLPYGKRGFSLMNVMPNHLSLIKFARKNGYHTKFLIGFNPDFDNMGGYIRLQGTDFVLSKYGAKYKEMGIGPEGWSMGYPDDALFSRSFEVMDSLKQMPYFNIYHTGTTHMPYLFEQKPKYDKLFDAKMNNLKVSRSLKETLKQSKKVLVTYMFADDCFRDFFAQYAKRPDFANTIFFITGDHHIGSFPATSRIDDYHVPLIVYSPMLKAPRKFYSINSHNNIAPTITALLSKNYQLPYQPKQVHWIDGVLDTAVNFRNIHKMPFMAWSRAIDDYIYKDYYLSENELYKIDNKLQIEPVKNDAVLQQMQKMLRNYRIINSYVCENDKVFPPSDETLPGEKKLLWSINDTSLHQIFTHSSDTSLLPTYKIPMQYEYLYVEMMADVNIPSPKTEDQPAVRFGLIDDHITDRNYVYWSNKDIVLMPKDTYQPMKWNHISANDLFTLKDYIQFKNMVFELALYTEVTPINLQMKNLKLNIYGIKK